MIPRREFDISVQKRRDELIADAEVVIDEAIAKARTAGNKGTICVDVRNEWGAVLFEILKTYRAGGWTANHVSSQHDGDHLEFL